MSRLLRQAALKRNYVCLYANVPRARRYSAHLAIAEAHYDESSESADSPPTAGPSSAAAETSKEDVGSKNKHTFNETHVGDESSPKSKTTRTRRKKEQEDAEPGADGSPGPVKKTKGRKKKTEVGGENDEVSADSAQPKMKQKRIKVTSSRDPMEPTKVDLYLASLRASGIDPTLQDIESCRPQRFPDPYSEEYPQAYNDLVDRLCRTFSRDQLRNFGEMYNIGRSWTRSGRRKAEYAEVIIEQQWNWPSLESVQREKRELTEVISRDFSVTPADLFLILGKDGIDLLQLSSKFNVHIAMVQNPLSLRVEGVRRSLTRLESHITGLRKMFVSKELELPTRAPMQDDLVRRISRLTGAFLENVGSEGKVRICAKSPSSLITAQRLAIRTACIHDDVSPIHLLSYKPAEGSNLALIPITVLSDRYSLYPFLSPGSLPWTMSAGGVFRVRKVGEWLVNVAENLEETGGLAGGKGHIATGKGDPANLKDSLLGLLPLPPSDAEREITASTGHVLIKSPAHGRSQTLVPPLKGHWPLPQVLKWAENNNIRPSFVSNPPALLSNSTVSEKKYLHRLVYHALPSHGAKSATGSRTFIKLELVLPERAVSGETSQIRPDFAPNPEAGVNADEVAELDSMKDYVSEEASPSTSDNLPDAEASQSEGLESGSPEDGDVADQSPTEPNFFDAYRVWYGEEATLDLMMPDRPMDMRLSVTDLRRLPLEKEPSQLQTYMRGLRSFMDSGSQQPLPPVEFGYEGELFILDTSTIVRRSIEFANVAGDGTAPVQVTMESTLDIESGQKSTVCQVMCDTSATDSAWEAFLTSCDRLSCRGYKPPVSASLNFGDDYDEDLL